MTLGAFLLSFSLITRINQAPGLLLLFGTRAGLALRQRTRGFLLAGGVLAVVAALPAVHNYVYGGRLVLTTTSATVPNNLRVAPTTYLEIWRDEGARTRVKEQLSDLFFTRRPNRPVWLVFRGLQALWVAALCSVFVRIRRSIPQRSLLQRYHQTKKKRIRDIPGYSGMRPRRLRPMIVGVPPRVGAAYAGIGRRNCGSRLLIHQMAFKPRFPGVLGSLK